MTPARHHLVWDWNGTLLNDLDLVVEATNAAFASVGGPVVTADEHRVRFRRPVAEYYAEMLGRAVDDEAFGRLDRIFHDAYRARLTIASWRPTRPPRSRPGRAASRCSPCGSTTSWCRPCTPTA